MTTREEWDAQEAFAPELAKLLRTEPLRSAVEMLLAAGYPNAGIASATDLTANALLNTRREGFFAFYNSLVALSKPVPTVGPRVEVAEPWAHLGRNLQKLSPET